MIISITGKHESVTEVMKDYAEKKIRSIVEDKHKVNRAIIVLSVEKNRFKAEFIVHGKSLDIEADCESFDMHESIDCAGAKIEPAECRCSPQRDVRPYLVTSGHQWDNRP